MLRVLDKRHDYVQLNEGFNRILSMIENCTPNQYESVERYASIWIDYVVFTEGFNILDKWYNIWIARLFGTFKYHQHFCDSVNFKIDYINSKLDEKKDILDNTSRSMGFIRANHKINKI